MDKLINDLIRKENVRQHEFANLIASENIASQDVMNATGSILTNKYAEGYPFARYYGGCEIVDEIEALAIKRANKIFNSKYSNVQAHSGTQANIAAYFSVLKPGDKILGMSLNSGGHLSHGYNVSITSSIFNAFSYNVDKNTHLLNYEEIREIAIKVKPKLIICGASSYARIIDFRKFREIADEVGAYLLADIAHIAGLVVAKLHPNPLDYGVDIVTTTTHKTLRGPRGALILTNDSELIKKINRSLFPGSQGGPLMNIIAAKAISFLEASKPEYVDYQKSVVNNSKRISKFFTDMGRVVLTGGTDNHMVLLNVWESYKLHGNEADNLLTLANIIINKNVIPFDKFKPTEPSGIRIGTPFLTSLGWGEHMFVELMKIIDNILLNKTESYAKAQRSNVIQLLKKVHD